MRQSAGRIGRLTALRVLAGSVLLAQMLSGAAPAAENNVRLYGALVAEPCVIPAGEETIALDFGSIVDKYLYLNTRTPGRAFSLHLTECDLSLGKAVSITFEGTESAALPGLLAPDGGSVAKGIAIGLETLEAKSVPLNQAMDKFTLQAENNVIPLRAYIRGEPAAITSQSITRGVFTATATFGLSYE